MFTPISISAVTIFFIIYYFLNQNELILTAFQKSARGDSQMKMILFQRLLGVLCFGIFPALLILFIYKDHFYKFGLAFKNGTETFFWLLIIIPLIIAINYFSAKTSANLKMYPQIRNKEWNLQLLILSAISWLAYLFAYEFMFRGFLLFSCLTETNLILAIVINVSLYALTHLPKGSSETIGAIPLGVILCIASYRTGTIWVPFGVHSALALSNEWFSIKYHPEMKVKLNF